MKRYQNSGTITREKIKQKTLVAALMVSIRYAQSMLLWELKEKQYDVIIVMKRKSPRTPAPVD